MMKYICFRGGGVFPILVNTAVSAVLCPIADSTSHKNLAWTPIISQRQRVPDHFCPDIEADFFRIVCFVVILGSVLD